MHVLDVATGEDGSVLLEVESDDVLTGCPDCGVVAIGHGRRVQLLHDAPCFARPVRVRWRKRIWRCPEPACARRTWTEVQPYATPRAKLTARATSWAVDALRHDDTTVSAIARHLGVAWDTCWSAIKADAQTRIAEPDRLKGIKTIGVDEHIVRHEALLVRMEVGDLDRFAVAAARWSWRQPVPGETLGSGGSSRDKVRAVRHYRTGRAW
jgi:transposase